MFGITFAVPKRSHPFPNGIGEERSHVLALDHEEREVVRDRVDERDRDEREHELRRQRPRRVHHPAGDPAGREEGAEDEDDGAEEAEQVDTGDEQLAGAGPVEDVRRLDPRDQILPFGRAAEAVEADRAERDGDEDHRARHVLGAGEAAERQRAA